MDASDLHGRWRIVEVAGAEVAGDDVADATGAEVEFSATADVTGSTGVNRFRALYTVVGDVLRVTPLAMTRMAGPPEAMAREHAIEAAFAVGGRLTLLGRPDAERNSETGTEDELVITDTEDAATPGLRLRRLGPAAPTAMVD